VVDTGGTTTGEVAVGVVAAPGGRPGDSGLDEFGGVSVDCDGVVVAAAGLVPVVTLTPPALPILVPVLLALRLPVLPALVPGGERQHQRQKGCEEPAHGGQRTRNAQPDHRRPLTDR
jgi:hypothetical protein